MTTPRNPHAGDPVLSVDGQTIVARFDMDVDATPEFDRIYLSPMIALDLVYAAPALRVWRLAHTVSVETFNKCRQLCDPHEKREIDRLRDENYELKRRTVSLARNRDRAAQKSATMLTDMHIIATSTSLDQTQRIARKHVDDT